MYCQRCHEQNLPCSRGEAGPCGERCPYHEHRPETVEGVEAWDVTTRCSSQLRVAPSGRVIGLDLGVVLTVGTALGYDGTALAELVPAVEAGLVAGLAKLAEEDHNHDD